MVIGFSGTRQGMTDDQKRVVEDLVRELRPSAVAHGWCKGADDDFDEVVRRVDPDCLINYHPGIDRHGKSPTRGHAKPTAPYAILSAGYYLVRDKSIVLFARGGEGVLIATPNTAHEVIRSGTWTTIRYARRINVPRYIVGPDGVLITEGAMFQETRRAS